MKTENGFFSEKNNIKIWRFISGIALSFLSALMLILAFHPHNVWILAFVAFIPMLIAQHRIFPIKWCGLAPAIGIGFWLLVFLTRMFGPTGAGRIIQIIVFVIIIIQLFTVPGIRRFHERTGYHWFVLQGVADWVGFEMIRSFIPPINTHAFIGQTMYSEPFMLQPISIFSIYGLGLLIMFVNFAVANGIIYLIDKKFNKEGINIKKRRRAINWLAGAGVMLIFWTGVSQTIFFNRPKNEASVRVAAIQHNFPKPGHQDKPEYQALRYITLGEQALVASQQGAKLIVFPELGLGFDPQVEYTSEFVSLAKETGAYLLIGYGVDDPRGWRNEMVMLTPSGEFLATYGKNHPTSPGEPKIITSGVYPVYDTEFGKISTLICNDIHWTNTSRRLARGGAQLIAVPTLESPGIANEQIAQSVLRAVENRVAIVKADVAYASAIIDPYGKIVAQRNGSPNGESFALVENVNLGTGKTFYNKTGDWPGWIALAGWIVFFILMNLKKRE